MPWPRAARASVPVEPSSDEQAASWSEATASRASGQRVKRVVNMVPPGRAVEGQDNGAGFRTPAPLCLEGVKGA